MKKGYRQPSLDISEVEWQRQFIDLAHAFGWKVAHFRPARTSKTYIGKDGKEHIRYVTPVQGDGKGFPDNILAKEGKPLLAVELKSEAGELTPEEREWLELWSRCQGGESYIFKPSDFEEAKEILSR